MFKKKSKDRELPTTPIKYPSGTCVKSESGYWFLKGTNRYKIISDRVLRSWSFPRVVPTTDKALTGFIAVGKIGFRDGTLLQDMAGNVYIIDSAKKRRLANPDWFDILAVDFRDAVVVSDDEINLHNEGEVLK